jgi:hypothetical protein
LQNQVTDQVDYFVRHSSVWLLAVAIGLCPAAATAGALAPSDTATGTGALASENGGYNNTADGYYALNQNTAGLGNTASGAHALLSNTTGSSNTASGYNALKSNTSGFSNTASGASALLNNTTGLYNTAQGAYSLLHNTTGSNNNATGFQAIQSNTTGKNNVALGSSALYANTAGSNNVAIGNDSLSFIKGNNNIALGTYAGRLTPAGSSNIYIGSQGSKASESKVIRIGKAQTKTFIAGIAGVPLSGATVVVRAGGQLGIVASSARYKQDIRGLGDGASAKLAQLRPVSYRYKSEPGVAHYGVIAEEVDRVMPELVVRDDAGRPESVQYLEIVPLLLQQWKAQRALNARQEMQIAVLKERLRKLENVLPRATAASLE